MPVTRAPDFPPDIANLVQALSTCADGHQTSVVVEAAANFLIAAITAHARLNGRTVEDAKLLADALGAQLAVAVAEQWDRKPLPTDIEVRRG